MAKVKTHFWIHEASALTGFSKYMLDYLARERIYVNTTPDDKLKARGRRRRYTYGDLVVLRALKAICDGSGRIRHLKQSLESYRDRYGALTPDTILRETMVSHGKELYGLDDDGDATAALSGQRAFAFHVDLETVTTELSKLVVYDPDTNAVALIHEAQLKANEIKQEHWRPIHKRRHG